MSTNSTDQFFKSNVLGHPSGLFVLFFTEMWERFSYYGMRALLVLFLTSALFDEGWGWPREHALALYGTYTSLVYLTPIIGGYIADKIIGYRKAVILGALIMTLGHAAMALETPIALYIGLFLLVAGNGFFKPTMTSIISQMYENHSHKKDGAFTIYYMGVNAGAFLGILLCGYLGEQWGWGWGFGLAGIFMFFGMLQFYFTQGIFAHIGLKPDEETGRPTINEAIDKLNPFTGLDKIFIVISAVIGLVWVINDPVSKIGGTNLFDFNVGSLSGSNFMILFALGIFLILLVSRIIRYSKVVRDKMIAVSIFAFFTVFFWAAFEQAGGSMTIFAGDYTDRVLEGSSANIFRIVNTLITIIPLGVITWVLYKLFKNTFAKYALGNIILALSFLIVWGFVITMLYEQYNAEAPEVPASWFSVLNSLFIIIFAPLFSKLWESKYNPSAAVKYGVGLILLGVGFLALAYGSSDIPQGAQVAAVSMIWLVLAYFFHTMGELCLSPVGLSYLSKLVPARMIAFMFGIWYLAIAIGNKLAGSSGGMIDKITAEYSLATFFMLFFIIPASAGVLIMLLNPLLKKLMHGVR
ncbi:MAG: POT family proton-dependent oligopeptide transporter [Flavobacteriales bacterium]|jgi:POT family proton-dependent oligopeptide transporter